MKPLRLYFLRPVLLAAFASLSAAYAESTTSVLNGGDAGEGLTLDAARVVYALNFNATESHTVQGVTFTPVALGYPVEFFSTLTYDPFATSETSIDDAGLRAVFHHVAWDDGGASPTAYTFTNLVANGVYRFDVLQFTGDFAAREQAIVVNNTLAAIVAVNQTEAKNTTFETTADASGQIQFLVIQSGGYGGLGNQDGTMVNAVVVTAVASSIPEPSAAALLAGVGVLGIVTIRRRRATRRID